MTKKIDEWRCHTFDWRARAPSKSISFACATSRRLLPSSACTSISSPSSIKVIETVSASADGSAQSRRATGAVASRGRGKAAARREAVSAKRNMASRLLPSESTRRALAGAVLSQWNSPKLTMYMGQGPLNSSG